MHRFVWDLHYPAAPSVNPAPGMPGGAIGPWASPGQYQVKLTAGGQSYTQSLTVKMDPRVKTSQADLVKQFEMAQQIGAAQSQVVPALVSANHLHDQLQSLTSKARDRKPLTDQIGALDRKIMALVGDASASPHSDEEEDFAADLKSLRSLNTALVNVNQAIESADVAPTADAITAFGRDRQAMQKVLMLWSEIVGKDVPNLNVSLKQADLPPVLLEEAGREGN